MRSSRRSRRTGEAQAASDAEGEVAAGRAILWGEEVVWNEDVPAPPTEVRPFLDRILGER